jgi:hypothetical protein
MSKAPRLAWRLIRRPVKYARPISWFSSRGEAERQNRRISWPAGPVNGAFNTV